MHDKHEMIIASSKGEMVVRDGKNLKNVESKKTEIKAQKPFVIRDPYKQILSKKILSMSIPTLKAMVKSGNVDKFVFDYLGGAVIIGGVSYADFVHEVLDCLNSGRWIVNDPAEIEEFDQHFPGWEERSMTFSSKYVMSIFVRDNESKGDVFCREVVNLLDKQYENEEKSKNSNPLWRLLGF